jgi:RHS repeat-associated protein
MLTSSATDNAGAQSSVYDCSGRRVQTSANSVTRQMVYDVFGKVVAEYKGGSLERENIYRGGQLLAVYEAASSCYKSIDQFIKDFYQGALSRQPNSTELSTWTTKLTQAQARGVDALIGTAQDLGNTLFTSSEYPNTNTNTQFVTDLYESFLQRSPDTGGLNFWAGNVPGDGRENVRRAFALSTEFTDNVAALCVGTSTSASLTYVLTDVQGSGRALMNNSGSGTSTIIARHDYLPFGEEIWAGVGLRTTSQKYAVTDKVRQRFAMTERDEATGLDHTLFRKYDSYAGRWTSPDPYRGSINPMNPQSLNRYSYGNDPVNMIDPTGLCTFNINLTGVSGQQLTDMQNEITRIFESGGHNVVFNNPGAANGGSMNLAVVSSYPANVEAFISNQGANPRNIPGVTMPGTGSAHVNSNVLFFFNPNPYFTQASLGTVEGRVGAHEVVQHGFLGWGPEGWTSDITRSNVRPNTLFKPSTGRFDMSASTAEALGKLCPPDKKPAANAVHELLHGVGGGPDIGFFGGFYGYPSWWYDMWAFVDWVNSIPVGGEREVEINDEGPVQPRPTRPPILKR